MDQRAIITDNPPGDAIPLPPLITERPGKRVGRYKLLQNIGEGGCGVVFLAEQEQPVRRLVALKVIKPGMDTRAVVARFEAERQALAMMDHPHIAKVLDGGATDAGRPYFVMELVRGMRITDYCDENNLSTEQRLALFVQVCHAIQHAHQKGIIHRDLKPSNILVMVQDGVVSPKVIDFGIAKATEQRLTDKTLLTEFQQVIGTPAYMSPEQADMTSADIDTRSDVYSLGVLLYELLTGRTPLDTQALLRGGLDEMRRKIREEDPPKPSTRLSGLSETDRTNVASHRRSDPAELASLLRGDLDSIVMKCLEKDRSRRYETANGLAMDVQRHLAHEPVLARPANAIYRFRKLVRRNRGPAVVALTAAVLVLLGIIGLIAGIITIKAERNIAVEAGKNEAIQRTAAENARADALHARDVAVEETYRALLSETRALRLAHPSGWRNDALGRLRRLAGLNTPSRDIASIRTEGVACIGEFDMFEVIRFEGHREGVWSLDFSPDGLVLASAGYEGYLRYWDLQEARHLRDLVDPATDTRRWHQPLAPLPAVRFHPKGDYLVYASWLPGLRTDDWDQVGRKLPVIMTAKYARYLAFDRLGKRLAVGWGDGYVTVHDAATGAEQHKVDTQTGRNLYFPVALHPNGETLAAVGPQNEVLLYDLGKTASPARLGRHRDNVRSLCFNSAGDVLASASADGTVKLWQAARPNDSLTLLGHTARVQCVAFSADDALAATVSDDESLRLWDARTGQLLMSAHPRIGPLLSVAFSPDGRHLAVGSDHVLIYRLTPRQAKRQLAGNTYMAHGLAFHPRRPLIASGTSDRQVNIWDLTSGELIKSIHVPQRNPVLRVAFHPAGELLAVGLGTWATASDRDFSIVIYDWQSGNVRARLSGPRSEVKSMTFDASGALLAAGTTGEAFVWDVASGSQIRHWSDGQGSTRGLVLLDEGRELLVASASGRLAIHRVAGDRPSRVFEVGEPVERVAASPDQREIAVGSSNGTVRFLSLPDFKEIAKHERAHELAIRGIDFTGDGRLAVTGGYDRQVIVWDARSHQRLFDLPQGSAVYNVAFDADGLRLGICGAEKLVTVWNLAIVRPELAALGLDFESLGAQSSLTDSSSTLPVKAQVKRVQAPARTPVAAPAGLRQIEELLKARQYAKVLELADREMEAGRETRQLQLARADAYYQLHQYDNAIEAGLRHLELCPGCIPATLRVATYYEAQNRYSEAVRVLQRALTAYPDNATLSGRLARLYVIGPPSLRRPLDALSLAQRARALSNDDTQVARTLGLAYYRLEKFTQAAETLRAEATSPSRAGDRESALSQLVLALCLWRLGDIEHARQLVDRAVAAADSENLDAQLQYEFESLRDEATELFASSTVSRRRRPPEPAAE
jgi:WD40 repeat protein/tetratricopeptide (TPR) repeat protein